MQSLFEKYRPRTFDDVLGQDKVVKRLQGLQARIGFGGQVIWLSGGSGQGKSSLAYIIARTIAGPLGINEINANRVDLDYVRNMEREMESRILPSDADGKMGRAWVFNESHNFRAKVCEELLTVLEPDGGLPNHVVVIMTTTVEEEKGLFEGYDNAPAFMSRFKGFKLDRRGLADVFAERVSKIADKEGLNGKPIQWYKRLAMDHRNNMRSMLQAIEAGEALE